MRLGNIWVLKYSDWEKEFVLDAETGPLLEFFLVMYLRGGMEKFPIRLAMDYLGEHLFID
jgi:hypothetical protein